MPKIGMVCYFDPDTYPGVYNSCNILVEQGWDVDVICLDQYGFCGKSFDPRVRLHRIHNRKVRRKQGGFGRFIQLIWYTRKVGLKYNWDTVIGHDMYGFVAARLSGVTKAPHVAFWSQDLAEPARLSKGQKIIFLLKKHFLKDCLLVVAPSRMRAEALKLFFGLRVDPYIVYNSPRFNMVMPKENWRHRLGIRHNTPLVIYGGGFGRDRYVPELVESVALWPKESFLVLAGYGQPEMIEELQNISRREGISDRVFIVGHLPSIFGLIQEAQVGVSFFNCGNHHDRNLYFRGLASNKIFEYLSLGKPSAVSHNEETAAFMDEFRCGVCVSDHSPHAIAEVITRLLTDGQALENLSRNALATHQRETYFENRFSILQRSLSRIIQARRPATHTSITQDSNNG